MFYSFLRFLANFVLMPLFFVRVIGKENFKKPKGGSIVIAHHTSNWDPIILGYVVKHKPVSYLAKAELHSNKVASFFLRHLHTIPIARGKRDLGAVKSAIHALDEDKMIGIFPEGTRSTDGSVLPFNPGAAMIAMRADVPVIPVYIQGGYRPFRQVKVHVDPPIDLRKEFDDKVNGKTIRAATDMLHEKIVEMSQRS